MKNLIKEFLFLCLASAKFLILALIFSPIFGAAHSVGIHLPVQPGSKLDQKLCNSYLAHLKEQKLAINLSHYNRNWALTQIDVEPDQDAHFGKVAAELSEIGFSQYLARTTYSSTGVVGSPADIESRLEEGDEFELGLMELMGISNSKSDLGYFISGLHFSNFTRVVGEDSLFTRNPLIGSVVPVSLKIGAGSKVILNPEVGEESIVSYDLDVLTPPINPRDNTEPALEYLGYWSSHDGYHLLVNRDEIPQSVFAGDVALEVPAIRSEWLHDRTNFWRVKYLGANQPNAALTVDTLGYIVDPIIKVRESASAKDEEAAYREHRALKPSVYQEEEPVTRIHRHLMKFNLQGIRLPNSLETAGGVSQLASAITQASADQKGTVTIFSHIGFQVHGNLFSKDLAKVFGTYYELFSGDLETFLKSLQPQGNFEIVEGWDRLRTWFSSLAADSSWTDKNLNTLYNISQSEGPSSSFIADHIQYAIGAATTEYIDGLPSRVFRIYLYFDNRQALRIYLKSPLGWESVQSAGPR